MLTKLPVVFKTGVCSIYMEVWKMKAKNKVFFLSILITLLAGGVLFAGGSQGGAKQEPKTLKWSIAAAADNPFSVTAMQAAQEIKEQTGIEVQVYHSASLAGDAEGIDLTRSGGVDIVTVGLQHVVQFQDDLEALMLPFVFDNDHMTERYCIEYLIPEIMRKDPFLKSSNLYTLSFKNLGPKTLGTKGIPVKRPSDLAGKKIRSMENPVAVTTIKALGGSPVPIAFAELYMALQTGVVVGQDNPIPNYTASKFYEVQDYMMLTEHVSSTNMDFMNLQTWESFSPANREKIQAIFDKYQTICNNIVRDSQKVTLDECRKRGMTIIENKDLDIAAFKANADRVINEDFKDAKYDAMRARRQQALEWCEKNQ
jgi:tripartite ATP-independent transporter DctP family solute receptor